VTIDAKLYEYATPRQREFLDAIAQHGSARAANVALGLSSDVVGKSLRRLKAFAARMGYAPGHFENGTAPGYVMGKVTVQRAGDGTVERTTTTLPLACGCASCLPFCMRTNRASRFMPASYRITRSSSATHCLASITATCARMSSFPRCLRPNSGKCGDGAPRSIFTRATGTTGRNVITRARG